MPHRKLAKTRLVPCAINYEAKLVVVNLAKIIKSAKMMASIFAGFSLCKNLRKVRKDDMTEIDIDVPTSHC